MAHTTLGVILMVFNTPIPQSLATEIEKCTRILKKLKIPPAVLEKARGVAIVSIFNFSAIVSGSAGSGIVLARLEDDEWSAPAAISTMGGGFNLSIGTHLIDVVFVLNTSDAVKEFCRGGKFSLKELKFATGPNENENGEYCDVYVYEKSKGIAALLIPTGEVLKSTVIVERNDANKTFYEKEVSIEELLTGKVPAPKDILPLHDLLE
ncbi:hypothetical protein HK103_005468 [Boothiomyces macroporosus]|uniref:Ysc84 actin-binding domain-containing protein n=1 Tax=Boothiomyces macroporosus TaxID=261099 RepID=A0AAD5UF24_9FUNG|nr:hypothetical protein HK103_005468 [Boothiomyces macroporosus]